MAQDYEIFKQKIKEHKIAITLDYIDDKFCVFEITEDGIEKTIGEYDRLSAAFSKFAARLLVYGR